MYDVAVAAIRAARKAGFRVTTNSTLFTDADPVRYRRFFDEVMALGVEGMMISPGYSYEKAPDQEHFLARQRSQSLFARILENAPRRWKFNQSPVFLEFLKGNWDLECRPWGTPTYNLFGWQKPCYLLDEGYATSFRGLMEETSWANYGRASGNPKCGDCMVHCCGRGDVRLDRRPSRHRQADALRGAEAAPAAASRASTRCPASGPAQRPPCPSGARPVVGGHRGRAGL